jgi:hypothetical protein
MIGVTPTANFPHIPPLNELCRLLWRHFMNGNNTTSDEQIDKLLEPRPLLRVRFAFMRMATIINHFENADRNISQWDQMDRILAKLRRLPVNYTKQSVFPLFLLHITISLATTAHSACVW